MPGGSAYTRNGLFYRLMEADVKNTQSWAVVYGGKTLAGPVKLPQRPIDGSESFRVFTVADMDITKYSVETVKVIKTIKQEDYDLFIHVGDFAYEIESREGATGDEFFQEMSTITKSIPYIITPGNHENFDKGRLMNYRFRMPNTDDSSRQNHFFDMVYKGAYFMFVNFDYYLRLNKLPEFEMEVFNWMKSRIDLLAKRKDV